MLCVAGSRPAPTENPPACTRHMCCRTCNPSDICHGGFLTLSILLVGQVGRGCPSSCNPFGNCFLVRHVSMVNQRKSEKMITFNQTVCVCGVCVRVRVRVCVGLCMCAGFLCICVCDLCVVCMCAHTCICTDIFVFATHLHRHSIIHLCVVWNTETCNCFWEGERCLSVKSF